MGLTALFALVAIAIIIATIVYIYNKNVDKLFPPYQEPIKKCPFGFGSQEPAKEDINWPFPTSRKP